MRFSRLLIYEPTIIRNSDKAEIASSQCDAGHHTDRDQEGKQNKNLRVAHLTCTASWARNNSRWGDTRSISGVTTLALRHLLVCPAAGCKLVPLRSGKSVIAWDSDRIKGRFQRRRHICQCVGLLDALLVWGLRILPLQKQALDGRVR